VQAVGYTPVLRTSHTALPRTQADA